MKQENLNALMEVDALPVGETAKILGVTPRAVTKLVESGSLKEHHRGPVPGRCRSRHCLWVSTESIRQRIDLLHERKLVKIV